MFLRNWARLYSNCTPSERLLEDEIKKLGERYRAQHPFFRHHLIADFALLDRKVVIEVDGNSHLLDPQKRKDIVHTLALEKEGWAVVRVTNVEVAESASGALKMAFERLTHRRSIQELESALSLLPSAAPKAKRGARTKTGARRPRPAPKTAKGRKRGAKVRGSAHTPLNSDTPLLE